MNASEEILQRLRSSCLSFPESSESTAWSHPVFRAGEKPFAAFEIVDKRPSIAFRLDASNIDALMSRKEFFVTPYGRGQWVSVWVDTALDWSFVEELLEKSYRTVALKRMIAALDTRAPRHLDSLAFTRYLADQRAPRLTFSTVTRQEAEAWQSRLRRKLKTLVGGIPRVRCALRAETTEKVDFPEYTRETVLFQSRDRLTVFAYFLMPKGVRGKPPVMICLPGHGRGVDDIVGISEDGTMRAEWGGYQNDFALQAVHHGFAALAIEQFGFGHRRDDRARRAGAGVSSCMPASGAAFLLGQTMVGWRVYDVIRAVDYLRTRRDVASRRIGCMGISGGGTITFFAAALDTRIRAAMISGYFNSFRDSILSIPHCIDNYVPGILDYAEMADIAGLIAPRPLFIESGVHDPIFPVDTTREAFIKARAIYETFDARDRIGMEIFDRDHVFHGVQAFPFLKTWL